jgi:hypothetical protein
MMRYEGCHPFAKLFGKEKRKWQLRITSRPLLQEGICPLLIILLSQRLLLKNLFLSLSIRSQAVTLTEESQYVTVAAETEESIV